MPPSRAGIRWKCTVMPRRCAAAGKVVRLPRGELEGACDQDDHTDRDWNSARQRRLLHFYRRQRDARPSQTPSTQRSTPHPPAW